MPAQGLSPIDPMCKHSKLYLVCGVRGPFLEAVAMVVMAVVVGRCWLIYSGRLVKSGLDHTNSMVRTMVWTANYLDE